MPVDLDWFADTGEENVEDDKLILSDPEAARAKLARDRARVLRRHRAGPGGVSPGRCSLQVDAAALTDELGDYFARRNRAGLAPGIEGWWDDSVAMLKPWGILSGDDPGTGHGPTSGRQDLMLVPFGHGEIRLARRVSKADPGTSPTMTAT